MGGGSEGLGQAQHYAGLAAVFGSNERTGDDAGPGREVGLLAGADDSRTHNPAAKVLGDTQLVVVDTLLGQADQRIGRVLDVLVAIVAVDAPAAAEFPGAGL